ncbi:hypothetical protein CHUAL_013164 [Chamberlinius hualienensis]
MATVAALAFFTFIAISTVFAKTTPKLLLVQVLSRHGARTPLEVWDVDPHKDYWLKQGLGQLTNLGKDQHFKLGQLLKQKYQGFLNQGYEPDQVLVNSTSKPRTLMSAYSNLAGLFPPENSEVWNKDLAWQPIPVYTKPKPIDYILDTDSTCPRWSQLYEEAQKSAGMKAIDQENAELYKLATKETGYNVTGIFTLNDVYDTFFIETAENFSLPSWVTPAIYHQLDNLTNVVFNWKFANKEMLRLRGGPFLKQMLSYVNETITGHNEKAKIYMYFAHDFLLAAVLMELGVFNGIAPPFASSILFELYQDPEQGHAIQVSYRNTTDGDYKVLVLPNCTEFCPLPKFVELTKDYIPENIVKECNVSMNSVEANLIKNW